MRITLFLLLSIITGTISGQTYQELINKAETFYDQKAYLIAARMYQKAFEEKMEDSSHVFNAAKTWVMADKPEEAFKLLKLGIDKSWMTKEMLYKEQVFDKLHNSEEWPVLMDRLKMKARETDKRSPMDTLGKNRLISRG